MSMSVGSFSYYILQVEEAEADLSLPSNEQSMLAYWVCFYETEQQKLPTSKFRAYLNHCRHLMMDQSLCGSKSFVFRP